MNDNDTPNTPQTGDVVEGRYVLLRVLGKGGMGIVFEAKHRNLPGKLAIKFLLTSNWNGPAERERFQREARAGRKLESEHSVRVTDFGEFVKRPNDDALQYIVMEYLDGKDLHDIVGKEGPLPIPTAVDYILQACIALAEAHAKGIWHRDLKPSNLFLANRVGSPIVKLLDFGLVKDATGSVHGAPATQTGVIAGTIPYMPKEQFKGLKFTSARTDIYSLAVCLYFLLTQNTPFGPFPGDEVPDVMMRILGSPPQPMHASRPDAPQGLVDALEWALRTEPEDRPSSIVEFARALVPFGSTDAPRLFGIVERTAIAAAEAGAKTLEDEGLTIKIEKAPPLPDDPTTIPVVRKPDLTVPQGRRLAPPSPIARKEIQRRTVVAVSVAAALLMMLTFVVAFRGGTEAEPTPLPTHSSPKPIPSSTPSVSTPEPTVSASASASVLPRPPPPPGPKVKPKPANPADQFRP